jgi:hypothetical protein
MSLALVRIDVDVEGRVGHHGLPWISCLLLPG